MQVSIGEGGHKQGRRPGPVRWGDGGMRIYDRLKGRKDPCPHKPRLQDHCTYRRFQGHSGLPPLGVCRGCRPAAYGMSGLLPRRLLRKGKISMALHQEDKGPHPPILHSLLHKTRQKDSRGFLCKKRTCRIPPPLRRRTKPDLTGRGSESLYGKGPIPPGSGESGYPEGWTQRPWAGPFSRTSGIDTAPLGFTGVDVPARRAALVSPASGNKPSLAIGITGSTGFCEDRSTPGGIGIP